MSSAGEERKVGLGLEELDSLIPEALTSGELVLVIGSPGTGKTVLAAKSCYENARRSFRCLYIGLQEDRERLYKEVATLGIDMEDVERRGLLKFYRIPVIESEEAAVDLLGEIGRTVVEFKPSVVVVDSVTPLLRAIGGGLRARAYLQNFFYNLARTLDKGVILVAEEPLGGNRAELGDLEYVADLVLILRQSVERGLITRYIEIRKVRGAPLTVAEVPFSIGGKRGVAFFIPQRLSGIVEEVGRELTIPCETLRRSLGRLVTTDSMLYEYPPHMRVSELEILPILMAVANGFKALVVSYRYSEDAWRRLLREHLPRYGADAKTLESVLESVEPRSYNPFAYSTAELNAIENRVIEELNPGFVYFHDVHIPMLAGNGISRYVGLLYNQILWLKSRGIAVLRSSATISRVVSRVNRSLADVVLLVEESEEEPVLNIWRRFGRPVTVGLSEVRKCLEETLNYIKRR